MCILPKVNEQFKKSMYRVGSHYTFTRTLLSMKGSHVKSVQITVVLESGRF